MKEDNPINRGGYFLNLGSQIGIDDLGKDLSLLHPVVGSGSADELPARYSVRACTLSKIRVLKECE